MHKQNQKALFGIIVTIAMMIVGLIYTSYSRPSSHHKVFGVTYMTMNNPFYEIINNELEKQFIHYHDFIQKQIQKNFQYYLYQRNGITSKIRLSQIYYIESLRHQIIIHSINGEMIERKTLSQFIKEIQSLDFIQIHKSYIINKRFIQEIKNQEVILKEQTHLPIGRSYKESLKEQN